MCLGRLRLLLGRQAHELLRASISRPAAGPPLRAHRYNQLNPKTDPTERSTHCYSTETRTRALDTMPFGKSLQVDMEVWHWKVCDMAYTVATYWYGDADTKTNRTAEADEAARPIVPPPPASPVRPRPPVHHLQNAIECETMKIVAKSGDFSAAPQPLDRYGGHRWSGANGLPAGEDIDTYAEKPGPFGPLELGVFRPIDGAFTLRAEVVGKNATSEKTGTYFGLDCVVISKETGDTGPHGGK